MMMLHTCGDVIPSLDVDEHVGPDERLSSHHGNVISAIKFDRSHDESIYLT